VRNSARSRPLRYVDARWQRPRCGAFGWLRNGDTSSSAISRLPIPAAFGVTRPLRAVGGSLRSRWPSEGQARRRRASFPAPKVDATTLAPASTAGLVWTISPHPAPPLYSFEGFWTQAEATIRFHQGTPPPRCPVKLVAEIGIRHIEPPEWLWPRPMRFVIQIFRPRWRHRRLGATVDQTRRQPWELGLSEWHQQACCSQWSLRDRVACTHRWGLKTG